MKTRKRQCKGKKADGTRCQATVQAGADYCFFHDPDKAADRKDASARGGYHSRMKTLPENSPDVEVQSAADIIRLLSETINHVRKGGLDPRIANAIGYLANITLRAIEGGDVEKRLAELEAAVMSHRPGCGTELVGYADDGFLSEEAAA